VLLPLAEDRERWPGEVDISHPNPQELGAADPEAEEDYESEAISLRLSCREELRVDEIR
jgi:hypothetical protein